MADKFFQLVSFVVNICPEPLRKMLLKYAKADKSTTFTTLDAYLTFRKKDIINSRKLRKDQLDLIYPLSSDADESQWDVSLLATLLNELFASSLHPMEAFQVKEIREIRNDLQHRPNSSSMTDHDHDQVWKRLETATVALARAIDGSGYEKTVLEQIDELKNGDVANIGGLLRIWYEEHIREMDEKIEQLNSKIDEMRVDMKETASKVRGAIVQKPGPAGEKNKRFKTVDNILSRLIANFGCTMKTVLEGSFDPPVEVADIRTCLRDKHHVIVSGSFNSRYPETALAAIDKMDYSPTRCAEISSSSDWRHIDPRDVDLVLFRNPFGEIRYEETKAKSVADIFSNMLLTSNGSTTDERVDIVLVTEIGILADVKQHHEHEILEDIVKVFDATTEKQPADLTIGHDTIVGTKSHFNPVACNLREFTRTFIHHYSRNRCPAHDDHIKTARETFKRNKVIVLVCPKEYGKVLAVALASSYKPSQCLLLIRPDDTLLVDSDVCLAIIDQFAGKYKYDKDGVLKWYEMFDHLQLAVEAGKLNVIVTCEKENLERCNEVFPHAFLKHTVEIAEDGFTTVKNEDVSDEQDGRDITDQTSAMQSRPQKRHKKVKCNGHGEFPIHLAAKRPNTAELQKIIDSGADVNVKDHGGWTPLHEACYKGLAGNAECLLQAGADINSLADGNNTPLHDAYEGGHIELVEMLLTHGANPNQRNDDGLTPADFAPSLDIKAKIEASGNKNAIPSESEMAMSDVTD